MYVCICMFVCAERGRKREGEKEREKKREKEREVYVTILHRLRVGKLNS